MLQLKFLTFKLDIAFTEGAVRRAVVEIQAGFYSQGINICFMMAADLLRLAKGLLFGW